MQQAGSRARWSPDGRLIIFDRLNSDGYFDIYLTNTKGSFVWPVTERKIGIGQLSNGNARYHPGGKFVVFVSEEKEHFLGIPGIGDPGIGMFSNFWATDLKGRFWQLTDIPIKQTLFDGIPAMGVVNPVFTDDGTGFLWTERYGVGGNNNWGSWRLKGAAFSTFIRPRLHNEIIVFQPTTGSYVTAMGFLGPNTTLVAGNLDGQHEYEMDQYRLRLSSLSFQNLVGPNPAWEEGSCISPDHEHIVYMSNRASTIPIDFDDPDWVTQPTERDFWIMTADGSSDERLTYLNDPEAPEYLGRRVIVAACDFSPDGRYIAATLGVDYGTDTKATLQLKLMLMDLKDPSQFIGNKPVISSESIVNGADLQPGVGHASWVTINGANLANATREWEESDFVDGKLPTSLEGVSVKFDGLPAYVYSISPTELKVLAPSDLPEGVVSVVVTNKSLVGDPAPTYATPLAPAFFTLSPKDGRYVAAVHPDGTIVGPDLFEDQRPARPGDIVQVYATGLGATETEVPAGQLVEEPTPITGSLRVWIGDEEAVVHYAGLVSPGLYQLNVEIPELPPGDHVVAKEIDGVRSPTAVYIFVDE